MNWDPPRLHTLNQNIGANYFKTKMKPKPTWREDSWTFVWAKESLSKPDTKGWNHKESTDRFNHKYMGLKNFLPKTWEMYLIVLSESFSCPQWTCPFKELGIDFFFLFQSLPTLCSRFYWWERMHKRNDGEIKCWPISYWPVLNTTPASTVFTYTDTLEQAQNVA